MAWTVLFLDARVEAEMQEQPIDIRARFDRIKELIAEHGPMQLQATHEARPGSNLSAHQAGSRSSRHRPRTSCAGRSEKLNNTAFDAARWRCVCQPGSTKISRGWHRDTVSPTIVSPGSSSDMAWPAIPECGSPRRAAVPTRATDYADRFYCETSYARLILRSYSWEETFHQMLLDISQRLSALLPRASRPA